MGKAHIRAAVTTGGVPITGERVKKIKTRTQADRTALTLESLGG